MSNWWSFLEEKTYRERKATDFRAKAEEFFRQKKQPEVTVPELPAPDKQGGGGILSSVFRGPIKKPWDVLRPAAKAFEWERSHISGPLTEKLASIPAPFVGFGLNEENPPGRTLLSAGPLKITAGFGKDESPATQFAGETLLAPSTYVGAGLTAKVASKIPLAAKYAPALARIEDIGAGGPVFRTIGKGMTKVGEPVGAAMLKPFAWATRKLAPDVPHIAGIEAKMIDESVKARWGRAATKAANFLTSTVKPAREEQAVLNRATRAARFGKTVGMREAAVKEGLQGPEAFAASRPGLAGEFPKATYEVPLAEEAGGLKPRVPEGAAEGITRQDFTDIYEIVRNSPIPEGEKWATTDALNMAFGIEMKNGEVIYTGMGRAPGMAGIARIQKVIGPELANAIKSQRTLGQKVGGYALEAVNLPRAVVAAYDYSAPLRQGLFMMGARPKGWAAATKRGLRWTFSPEYAEDRFAYMMTNTEVHPNNAAIMEKFNPGVTHPTGPIGQGEEYFQGELAEKIPLIQMSGRAYSGPLNEMRYDQFFDEIGKYEKDVGRRVNLTGEGEGFIKDITFLSNMSEAVKVMSGRGELPAFLKSQGGLMGFVFFAPRLLWSRLTTPALLFSKTPQVRTMAAKGLAGAAVANVALLSSMYVAGKATGEVDVEIDLRSTDFGKIRVGNTRIDFLGGYQPLIRYTAQLLTGQRKTTVAGEIMPVDMTDTMETFLRTKLSPVMGAVTDIWRGTTMLGDPITGELADEDVFWTQMKQRLVPMFIQDFEEAVKQSGMFPGALLALPGGFGASVMSYAWPSQKLDELSRQVMNQPWKDLNSLERKQFLEKSPEAQQAYTEYIDMGVRRGETWAQGLYETLESNAEFGARVQEMLQAGVPKAKIATEYEAYRDTLAFDGDPDREPRDEQEALAMGFFAIKPKILADGSSDLDTYYAERNAYMEQNGKTQEYFNQNELLKWKTPEVRTFVQEYQTSRDLWGQYYDIPSKLGMEEEELKAAKTIQGYITTMQFKEPGLSAKQALMQLPLSSAEKMLWLRYSRLPSNPAREAFRRQYGDQMVLTKPPEFGGALPTEVE